MMLIVLKAIAAFFGAVGFLIAYYIYLPRIRHWNFPGPKPWLLEGSLSGRKVKPGTLHQTLYDLRNKYGNVFHIWLGIRRLVSTSLTEPDENSLVERCGLVASSVLRVNQSWKFWTGDSQR
mmetsp:Transcript_19549/g.77910  ORF Transcript_19549/g.77910 Transcript_19549/m.77910 type:complete len:121 (-) Transcript_19549:2304-2666(-)